MEIFKEINIICNSRFPNSIRSTLKNSWKALYFGRWFVGLLCVRVQLILPFFRKEIMDEDEGVIGLWLPKIWIYLPCIWICLPKISLYLPQIRMCLSKIRLYWPKIFPPNRTVFALILTVLSTKYNCIFSNTTEHCIFHNTSAFASKYNCIFLKF